MNELLECEGAPRSGIRVALPAVARTQSRWEGGAMAQILTFAREWSKWYRVLRHHKGFGQLDSLRYSHWLARS
jgi:hypothetical protein